MGNSVGTNSHWHSLQAWEKRTLAKGRVQGGVIGVILGLFAGILLPLLT